MSSILILLRNFQFFCILEDKRSFLALAEGPSGPGGKMVAEGLHGRALWALEQKW